MRRISIEFALSLALLLAMSWCATATADDKNKEGKEEAAPSEEAAPDEPSAKDEDETPADGEATEGDPTSEVASETDESTAEAEASEPATEPKPEKNAEGAGKAPSSGVAFLHKPISSTRAGRSISIKGKVSRKWLIKRLVLACRTADTDKWLAIPFERSSTGNAVAKIPVEHVESPGVEYYVYLMPENEDDEAEPLFGSKDNPHRIVVHGFSKKSRYARRLAEWNGRLSQVEINYGYSSFGENLEPLPSNPSENRHTKRGNEYHEFDLAYTYRFLTYLYVMRVEIIGIAHDFADFKPFTAAKDEVIGPGMYAIAPSLEFEFAKYFGASLLLRLGISEEGFEGGGGTSFRIGRINSTRLDLGFEGMSQAGWRVFLRFEWDTVPHLPMGITVERTQWYAASLYAVDDWGNRMFYYLKALLPAGIGLRVHAGFANRDQAVKGGLVIGGGAWIDF